MTPLLDLVLRLPTRDDFAAGIATLRADLKALVRPKRRRMYRVSQGPRLRPAREIFKGA
jgi:hypothetical protein